jgi:selenide,water dikinase
MTDVTGFGLARHALNLATRAGFSGLAITTPSLPLIVGAADLLASGIRSSLHHQNRAATRIDDSALSPRQIQQAEIAFDPQTSGGLLAILPSSQTAAVLTSLNDTGHQAAIIGHLDPSLTGLSFTTGGNA